MTVETNNQPLVPKYTDYNSFLELFETCVDRHHQQDNIFIRYKVPNTNTFEFKTLTYSQVDTIATYLANQWEPMLLRSNSTKQSCIAVLNDSPIQAILSFFATLKLGLIYFPLSMFDSEAAILHLLKKSKTSILIASKTNREKAFHCIEMLRNDGDERIGIQVYDHEFDIDQMLSEAKAMDSMRSPNSQDDGDYPSSHKKRRTLIDKKTDPSDPIIYMHTSGSTALPKLISWTTQSSLYGSLGGIVDCIQHSTNGTELMIKSTDVLLYPVLTISGPETEFLIPTMLAGGSILLFDHKPPTPSEQLAAMEKFGVTLMISAPVGLEIFAEYLKELDKEKDDTRDKHHTNLLEGIKFCITYGVQLQIPIGDYLRSKGLNIQSLYGSTETSCISLSNLSKHNNKWYDITPTPRLMQHIMLEPYNEDSSLYHLVIRNSFPSLAKGVGNRPNGDYATKDLLTITKKSDNDSLGIWTLVGRMDDAINTKFGDKVIPGPMEKEIRNEEIIQHCTIIGDNRECTAVLVELNFDKAIKYSPVEMTSKVYDAVNRANKYALSEAMISVPSMVYILPLNKQLPKTKKGAVIRKESIVTFYQEIEQMYKNVL
ncbi:hypothetical protein BDA99DRAFT_580015 [Phascolomyces articulosus]|uniref:AMP-dependent synthetase/ligase domain-containing protein n=1 Tax=Phascolomyces articulosus TaxID=60185 RepID=A0AAD5K252_9FUNG|nr:hypothetical protein BDA99DRAFT_580015 [Phascolomyces articulosus]